MIREAVGVVFDCNTILQGAINERGPAAACLRPFESGEIVLYLREAVLAEIDEVLRRPKLQRKSPRLTASRVDSLLESLRSKGTVLFGCT
jgi:predicted nucleic acid-binding protein